MASKKKTGTAIVAWEDELKIAAKRQSVAPATGGSERNFISLKGGVMTFMENKIKGNTLDAVILDFAYVNSYYDKPYNPNVVEIPGCFAIGRDKDNLAPHKEAAKPEHTQCLGCPQNEFGSRGDGSKGKACKNSIRLTLIAAGDLDKPTDKWKIAYLNIPATSLKGFGAYYKANCCDEEGEPIVPTYSFITNILVEANAKTQFTVEFAKEPTKFTKEQFYGVRAKVEALADDGLFPFIKAETKPAPVKGSTRKKY